MKSLGGGGRDLMLSMPSENGISHHFKGRNHDFNKLDLTFKYSLPHTLIFIILIFSRFAIYCNIASVFFVRKKNG